MKKQSKWQPKKAVKNSDEKKRITLSGDDAQEFFTNMIRARILESTQIAMELILEKIVVKKGLKFQDICDEIMEKAAQEIDDKEIDEFIEMMADKIIKGKHLIEM